MKNIIKFLIPVLLFLLICTSQSFSQSNSPNPNAWAVYGGAVRTVATHGDHVYMGGDFRFVGPKTGSLVKVSSTTGIVDNNFPKVDGKVYTAAEDGNGGWYIGGDFISIGGLTRNNIARINSDGTIHPWNPNSNDIINQIVLSGNDIFVTGSFSFIGGQLRSNIAKLNNTTGDADILWNANTVDVSCITVSGNDVYVGGSFTSIGGQPIKYLAKLNYTTGNADPLWNPNPVPNVNPITYRHIFSIVVYGNDVYAAGEFRAIGGQTKTNLAKLNNTNGAADPNWNSTASAPVFTLSLIGNDLYVGGMFNLVGSLSRIMIARIDLNSGEVDPLWNPNSNNFIKSIKVIGSYVYAGGDFINIGGLPRNKIARLNLTNGEADPNWDPGANDAAYPILSAGNDILIGGTFHSVNGQVRNKIARINILNGKLDLNWDPQAGLSVARVECIAVDGSGVYVGGEFPELGGLNRNNIAKLNLTNGDADPNWDANADYDVYTIAINGNDIYAGGLFFNIGGLARNKIAKLNKTNGDADPNWNANSGNDIHGIAINGNDIYVCGTFLNIGGQPRNKIAKLNTINGDADPLWNPDANNIVLSVFSYGNDVFAGGAFTEIGGLPRNGVAKLNNTNGNADPLWNANANANSGVYSFGANGNKLYVGGEFTSMGGQSRNCLAKLDITDGSADLWNPDVGSSVRSIVVNNDDVYAGGFFNEVNNMTTGSFVMFVDRVLPVNLTSFISNVNGRNVDLIWSVSSEQNNSGFDIERKSSDENNEWLKIGFVNGRGTTNEPASYTFKDTDLNAGKYQYRLKQTDFNGNFEYFNLSNEVIIGVPNKFELSQNYPNPFNPSTKINFNLPVDGKVSLKLFDISGREVMTLLNETKSAGYYTVNFNGANLSSGIYFYRISVDGNGSSFISTKKMTLIK